MSIRFLAALMAVAALSACTSGSRSGPSAPSSATVRTSSTTAGPVPSAPTVVTAATSCPWAAQSFVKSTIGMRQGRITVLRSGGAVVGCRFYAQSGPNAECGQTCFDGEHLPPPSQPVVEVVTHRYATAVDAHNAFVLASRGGTDASTVTISSGVPGVTYRTTFYPKDGASDWACGWSVGATAFLVRLAENDSADEAATVAQQVARAQ